MDQVEVALRAIVLIGPGVVIAPQAKQRSAKLTSLPMG